MDIEDIVNDLDPLYEAAMKEQRSIEMGIEHLTKSAKDFISMRYAEDIHHLSAAGYLKLEDIISQHTTRLSMEISNTFYHHSE